MIKTRYLFFLTVFFLFQTMLFPSGVMEMFSGKKDDIPSLQDMYDGMDETLPGIGFFSTEKSENIDKKAAKRIFENITTEVVRRGEYKPFDLEPWFLDEYKSEKSAGIIEMRNFMINRKFPIKYISTINISRFTDKFYVQIALYTMKNLEDTIYVYRLLDNLDEDWDIVMNEMLDELFYRIENPHHSNFCSNTIYMEPFSIKFYDYYELASGEYSFTELPFISMSGVDFHDGWDLFSSWLGMRLHLSGLFPVVLHDLKSRVSEKTETRNGCNWGIKGDIRVSSVMSVLRLSVYDYRRRETVAQFDYPFNELSSYEVSQVIDMAIPSIMNNVLSREASSNLAAVKMDFSYEEEKNIYTEMGYQGPADTIHVFPVKVGLNKFLIINKTKNKTKTSPDLTSFNTVVLTGADGEINRTYTEKEILYAEKLFE
jgi:hypothetical protein